MYPELLKGRGRKGPQPMGFSQQMLLIWNDEGEEEGHRSVNLLISDPPSSTRGVNPGTPGRLFSDKF